MSHFCSSIACPLVLRTLSLLFVVFFFFIDTATTEIYTLSLHDALPIWPVRVHLSSSARAGIRPGPSEILRGLRSEEHTSELQSHHDLVCRLLLEKKKSRPSQHINLPLRRLP